MNVLLLGVVLGTVGATVPDPPSEMDGVRLRGFILGNAGWNLGSVPTGDLPFLALPNSGNIANENSTFATIRQTRIGVESTFHAGTWRLSGLIDVDFLGVTGSDPKGGLLETGLRLVRAYAEFQHGPFTIDVGQLENVFAPLNPDSLAYVSLSPLTFAGNLWNRTPQVRGTYRHASGFEAELAFLRPFSGMDTPTPGSQADPAGAGEQAGWGMTEARLGFSRVGSRTGWGAGVSYHVGSTDLVPGGVAGPGFGTLTQGIAADLEMRVQPITFKGEAFYGQNLPMLRSLGTPTFIGGDFTRGRTAGGWAQLGVILLENGQDLRLHGGFGIEDPFDQDLGAASASRNISGFFNVIYRPIPRLAGSVQWTVINTDYRGAASGTDHSINAAVQFLL